MEKIKIGAIIEVAGKPASHIEETVKKMISILKENKKISVLKEEIAPVSKVELPGAHNPKKKVEIFSSFADLILEFPTVDELMQFLFVFMPSSIEILEPENLKIKQKDFENSLNDLLAKLHEHSRIIMEYHALRKHLEKG